MTESIGLSCVTNRECCQDREKMVGCEDSKDEDGMTLAELITEADGIIDIRWCRNPYHDRNGCLRAECIDRIRGWVDVDLEKVVRWLAHGNILFMRKGHPLASGCQRGEDMDLLNVFDIKQRGLYTLRTEDFMINNDGQTRAEIQISDEMIKAGAMVVEFFDRERDDPRKIAREVFLDMLNAMERDSLHLV